jgi:hypothetical protein
MNNNDAKVVLKAKKCGERNGRSGILRIEE